MEEYSSRLIFTSDTYQTEGQRLYILIILDVFFFILKFSECFLKLCNSSYNSNMPHNFFVTRSPQPWHIQLCSYQIQHDSYQIFACKTVCRRFFFFQSLSPGYVWLYRLLSNLFLSAISFPGLEVLIYSGVPVTKATVHPDCFGHPAPCLLHV